MYEKSDSFNQLLTVSIQCWCCQSKEFHKTRNSTGIFKHSSDTTCVYCAEYNNNSKCHNHYNCLHKI